MRNRLAAILAISALAAPGGVVVDQERYEQERKRPP